MNNDAINKVLKRLDLEATGVYDNHLYVIYLEDSNDYAKMYTKLGKNAIDTEFPTFGTNTNNSTIKITNYFEIEVDNQKYNIFLIADFENDKYYLKIGGLEN